MTDNEIIEALEYCCHNGHCRYCPHSCAENKNIEDLALDLIKRQKAEIERLTINMNAFGLGMKREKERADTIRAEAIIEVVKLLKEKANKTEWVCSGALVQRDYTISEETLDNITKETVGEK